MAISKDEAVSALKEIGEARDKVLLMGRYRHAAPHLILWGGIWLIADSLFDFYPSLGGPAWVVLSLLGVAGSSVIGWRARAARDAGGARAAQGKWVVAYVTFLAYIVATQSVLPPLTASQCNALISLFFAGAYMFVGIWLGWKMFWVGLAMGALVLFGYFAVAPHYFLWVGVVSGGALMAGGIWLRRV